ncbi:MAG: hypothetical protein WEE69_14785 [Acidimicrobiia bacterium]
MGSGCQPCWFLLAQTAACRVRAASHPLGATYTPTIVQTPFEILLICTGNICRSVMAQSMLEARAAAFSVEVRLVSAGLTAEGVAPPRHAVALMRKRGLDITGHRSRRLTATMIDEADLVLGAARMHAWEAVALRPSAVQRVFTLREFVRLGEAAGTRDGLESLDAWIDRAHRVRRRVDGLDRDDDIEDPYRRSRQKYARVAAEIDSLVDRLADLLFPFLGSHAVRATGGPATSQRQRPPPAQRSPAS